jgi:hypothetical protein
VAVEGINEENIELLYQTRLNIFHTISNLMPSLSIQFDNASFGGLFSLPANILGFLIPSNWFNWRESVLYYRASQSFYLELLAGELNASEVLYFNVHKLETDRKIYGYYIKKIKGFLDYLESNSSDHKLSKQDIALLKSFYSSLKMDHLLIGAALKRISNQMADIYGEATSLDSFGVKPIRLPNLEKAASIDEKGFEVIMDHALRNSYKLSGMDYLKKALKYSRLTRIFSFFGTEATVSGSRPYLSNSASFNLDFSYFVNLRMGRSEAKQLDIEIDVAKEGHYLAGKNALIVHNGTIKYYKMASEGRNNVEDLFNEIMRTFRAEGTLDMHAFESMVKWGIKHDLAISFAKHKHLVSISNIERLKAVDKKYFDLFDYVPQKKKLRSFKDMKKIQEEKRIQRAISRGELRI